jgi:hypothetical protein
LVVVVEDHPSVYTEPPQEEVLLFSVDFLGEALPWFG